MHRALIESVCQWDERVCLRMVAEQPRKAMDGLMLIVTRLGDGYLYCFVAVLLLLVDTELGMQFASRSLAALVLCTAIYKIVKHAVRRDRPFEVIADLTFLVPPPDRFSFPSGHTATAFLMATVLTMQFPVAIAFAYGFAVLVGVSRVYVGVHYPSDVFVGAGVGCVSAFAALIAIPF